MSYTMAIQSGHYLLTLKLLQTYKNTFKDYILNNVGNQTVDGPH